MKTLKKLFLSVSSQLDDFWNRIVSVLGGPLIMFVFIKFVDFQLGLDTIFLPIFFIVASLLVAPTVMEGIISSVLGWITFIVVRPWFVEGEFAWWDSPTAISAAVSVFLVNVIINMIVTLKTN